MISSIIKKIKRLVGKENEEDMIHLRAIKYGIKFPSGFMYKHFKKHYEKRGNDWKVVDEFFQEAYNNKNSVSSRTTPFVLLEKIGNGNADEAKYILSYEAYFNYLGYRSSKKAIWAAVIAVGINVLVLFLSALAIYYSQKQDGFQGRTDCQSHFQKVFNSQKILHNKSGRP